MIKKQRRKFTNEFKFKVVLIAISDKYSIKEIAEMFDLDIKQITNWKKSFLTNRNIGYMNRHHL
ncbi:MAG: transposase [Bacteroidetes bacterium]|nr:transposase [Bacteroidota bacterium]